MNVKKYFTIVLCVVGVCLAVLSGIIVATKIVGSPNDPLGIMVAKAPKDRANILILGVDGGESRSDTIMLASLDNKNKKLSIMSIPRDTRVLDGKEYDKITHLYAGKKKEQATIDAVTRITGIPIHYYVIVDFKGFRNIMDALGGIDINVPNVNNGGMHYEDPEQNLFIHLNAGMQHLNGKQAEGFVRYRHGYAEGDIGRVKAQQMFAKELLAQKLQPQYFLKAPQIFKEVSQNVKTNYGIMDMTSHLITFKALKPEDIQTFQLPGYPSMANTRYGELSCFIYDQAKTDEMVKQNFMSTSTPTPTKAPAK